MKIDKRLEQLSEKIIKRSKNSRQAYLQRVQKAKQSGKTQRSQLGCANLAHAFAGVSSHIKERLKDNESLNLAIVSSYNDMLSAHQPFKDYPEILKKEAFKQGLSAQVAGLTPAMCDGITQGYAGMQLSLFSRDVIALSTAIALSHNVFDGAFYLGVCDKIVPGLLIGALSFGHLPALFVPSGPMTSGISNKEKARTRELFAEGKIDRTALLASEMASYHSAGTCTFYGTANSNQMMIEMMGLHLPNSAFINPNTPLRQALITQAAKTLSLGVKNQSILPIGELISEKNIINALIGLMATGGSTNHTIHLVAIARAAGIIINWEDFDEASNFTPLLARIYPNGEADVNHFFAAGGLAFVIKELLNAGLLHEEVHTVAGFGMSAYTKEPFLIDENLVYKDGVDKSKDENILRSVEKPFSSNGGLKLMRGNIGRSVIKISAVKEEHQVVQAKALVFNSQQEFLQAFEKGELYQDFIAVLRFQGARANGMPELHKLTPALGILQDKGYKVALITDGRMSGASGKVPAAIHLSPEALLGGNIAKIKDGDLILLDAQKGILQALVDEEKWEKRKLAQKEDTSEEYGCARELFAGFRKLASSAETGAMSFGNDF